MGAKSEYCQGEDQKMQDSERTDLAPVEDSDHPLMPYDYKYLDALRDVIVAHKGLAVVSVLALIASSAAASMGMMNFVIPSSIGIMAPLCFALAAAAQRARVRRERHISLAERARGQALRKGERVGGSLGFLEHVGVRIMATLRENASRLLGCALFSIGVGVLWGFVSSSVSGGLFAALFTSSPILFALPLLLLRDVLLPNKEIKRDIDATETVKIHQRASQGSLGGALSMTSGEDDGSRQGALTQAAEGGALTLEDDDAAAR